MLWLHAELQEKIEIKGLKYYQSNDSKKMTDVAKIMLRNMGNCQMISQGSCGS